MSTRARYNRGWATEIAGFLGRLFFGSSRGAGYVEYLLIAGFTAIGVIIAFQRFRARSNVIVRNQSKTVMALDSPTPGQVIADLGGYENYDEGITCEDQVCTWNGCFAAGTAVATEDGDRPIEQIRVGERVWSRNETTKLVALHPVTRSYITYHRYIVDLKLGHDGLHTETITATPNHLFWVEGQGWTPADELGTVPGWSPDGPLSLSTTFERTETATVYNLEIEGDHTYFVGHSHALVHNATGGNPPSHPCMGQPPGKTQAEIDDCVQQYLAAHPYSQYHDDPATLRARCTTEDYNPATKQLRDPEAGSYPPPQNPAAPKLGCATKTMPATRGNQDKAKERQAELCKGNTQDGIDISYRAGTLAAKNYVNKNFPSSDWDSSFDEGNNTFDGVLVNKNTGEVIIIEAKGGDSPLGTRWAQPGKSSGVRVQQGTKEYVESLVADMKDQVLAQQIRDALRNQQVRSIVVRQPFENGSCNPPTGKAKDVEITEYDMGTSNRDCPP